MRLGAHRCALHFMYVSESFRVCFKTTLGFIASSTSSVVECCSMYTVQITHCLFVRIDECCAVLIIARSHAVSPMAASPACCSKGIEADNYILNVPSSTNWLLGGAFFVTENLSEPRSRLL